MQIYRVGRGCCYTDLEGTGGIDTCMCRAGDVDIQIWRVLGVLIHICAGLGMLISRSGGYWGY